MAGLLEQIRDLLASLPVDCLGSDTDSSGQPYPIRDEVICGITKVLAQQPATVYEAYPTRSGPPAHGGCERCSRCREGDFARCKNRQYAYLAGQQQGGPQE